MLDGYKARDPLAWPLLVTAAGRSCLALAMRFRRGVISAIFFGAAIVYAATSGTSSRLAVIFDKLSLPLLLGVALALTATTLLAAVRLRYATRDFGHALTFLESLRATAFGGLAGYFFFQLIGQIAARSRILHRSGVSANTTAILTLYERIVALGVSALLATVGAVYLFGSISIDLTSGGIGLLTVTAAVILVTVAVATLAWRDLIRDHVIPYFRLSIALRVLRIAAITVPIQGCTLLAYVLAIRSFAPTTGIAQIAASSCIIMFAASIPISFAGWGIREFSAIGALGAIGIGPAAAVTSSLVIGTFSLAVLCVIAYSMTLSTAARPSVGDVAGEPADTASRGVALMVFPLATALLVFFQIEVPVLGDTITVSPADLIAAICGVLILLEAIKTPRQFFSAIPLYGCIASVAFLAAYLHGVYSFGVTPWATSKFIGWFVLLSYCVAGAMLASAIDLGGIRRLALTISIALAVIVVFSLIVTFPNGFSSLGLAGFAGNRNAFAFQLVICMAAGLAVLRDHPYWRIIAIALAFGIFSAGSFAGFGTLAIICVTSLYFYPRDWLSLVFPLAVGCVLYFAMVVALSRFEAPQTLAMFAHYQSSDAEHWLSMRAGLALFMTHPLMGSGLGYFYDHVLPEESGPLVIHNVAIWILAEFGIGGLLLALGFIVHMVRAIIASWPSQAAELALLAGLMFGAFGMAHDIFYQRSFWFVLGAALAGLNAAPALLWSARQKAAPLA